MINRNLIRGLFIIALALLFLVPAALHYPIGSFAEGGPGLFPVIVSCLLVVIGVAMTIRALFTAPEHLPLNIKNITLIVLGLCTFAVLSEYINMIAGIVAMVFISTLAATSYSWWRNVKVAAVLVLFAFGFQKLLGLNLPLY